MKIKNIISGLLVILTVPNLMAATNTGMVKITSVETRDSGYHALFISGDIPTDQNCNLTDRAIIVETDSSSKTMLSASLAALAAGKEVIVQVSGCTIIHTGYKNTAPIVSKIQIFN